MSGKNIVEMTADKGISDYYMIRRTPQRLIHFAFGVLPTAIEGPRKMTVTISLLDRDADTSGIFGFEVGLLNLVNHSNERIWIISGY